MHRQMGPWLIAAGMAVAPAALAQGGAAWLEARALGAAAGPDIFVHTPSRASRLKATCGKPGPQRPGLIG